VEVVTNFLRDRRMLLVFDNCEHVVDACAKLIDRVLRVDTGVRILATSRQRLGVTGEHVWSVPALPVPDADVQEPDKPGSAVLTEYPGVALFAERAAAVSGFSLTRENWPNVARLCRRLDGLPLAIELAAVRIRVLSVGEILQRLDDRFELLEGIDRAAPSRHRTLGAAVEGSYELCSPQERLLWARACVFAGRFDLDAAEGVCSGEGLPAGRVLDAVSGLVDKSILVREEQLGVVRFRLLDTLARYGRERLREAGEEEALARRHRDWYLELAERMEAEWFSPGQLDWSRRMRREHANLQVALTYCLTTPRESQAALRLAAAVVFYWSTSGIITEARLWLDRALALDTSPTHARARALQALGLITSIQGDNTTGYPALRECGDLARRFDDPFLGAYALGTLATVAMRGDLDEAVEFADEALACPQYANEPHRCQAFLALTMVRTLRGEHDLAIAASGQIRRCSEACGECSYLSWALVTRAFADFGKGDRASAAGHAREALKIKREFGDTVGIGLAVMILTWTTLAAGDLERGTVLLGARRRLLQSYDLSGGVVPWDALTEQYTAEAQEGLGQTTFQRAVARGLEFDLDRTVEYALGTGDEPAAVSVPEEGGAEEESPLTQRENQVAELVARGMSNKRIADHLVIAQRTAEGHVEHILTKLGFTSRAQIAAWVTQRDGRSGSTEPGQGR
jgi:non-specific serine/threonine protein kinase